MTRRTIRDVVGTYLLVFLVVALSHFIRFQTLSLSLKNASVDAVCSMFITAVLVLLFTGPLVSVGHQMPYLPMFIGRMLIRVFGLYLIAATWTGATRYISTQGIAMHDLISILRDSAPSAPSVILIVILSVLFAVRISLHPASQEGH